MVGGHVTNTSFFGMSRALSLLIFSNEASLIFPLDIVRLLPKDCGIQTDISGQGSPFLDLEMN